MSSSIESAIDPWNQTRKGVLAFVAVLIVGTLIYRALGLTWVDAYYQTVITVFTVGYSEIGPEATPLYRMVTTFVVIFGCGIALYTIGVTFSAFMEGHLQESLGRTRMQRAIDDLEDHNVVAGWGQVGKAIGLALLKAGEEVVVIDFNKELNRRQIPCHYISGDATHDEVLTRAGVLRAKSLVVALDDDADNVFITLSARGLNPDLFIVSRSNTASSAPKLSQAGADRVVNPHEIGADRMVSFMIQPNVADFLGETMSDRQLEVKLHEVQVAEGSDIAGMTLGSTHLPDATGITVLALRHPDGEFLHHPDGSARLEEGDILITLGTEEQLIALDKWMMEHKDH